jgi:hypothetical protein
MARGKKEIGRELKVSELQERTVVWLSKYENQFASMWVWKVDSGFVAFQAGKPAIPMILVAIREDIEPGDRESICDDTGARLRLYEYLGEV